MHVNEAIKKLLEGKKIRRKFWPSYMFVRIKDDKLFTNYGNSYENKNIIYKISSLEEFKINYTDEPGGYFEGRVDEFDDWEIMTEESKTGIKSYVNKYEEAIHKIGVIDLDKAREIIRQEHRELITNVLGFSYSISSCPNIDFHKDVDTVKELFKISEILKKYIIIVSVYKEDEICETIKFGEIEPALNSEEFNLIRNWVLENNSDK